MIKRSLLLLLMLVMSGSLYAITIFNDTNERIEFVGYVKNNQEKRYHQILNPRQVLDIPKNEGLIYVSGIGYPVVSGFFRVRVRKNQDGSVDLNYKLLECDWGIC